MDPRTLMSNALPVHLLLRHLQVRLQGLLARGVRRLWHRRGCHPIVFMFAICHTVAICAHGQQNTEPIDTTGAIFTVISVMPKLTETCVQNTEVLRRGDAVARLLIPNRLVLVLSCLNVLYGPARTPQTCLQADCCVDPGKKVRLSSLGRFNSLDPASLLIASTESGTVHVMIVSSQSCTLVSDSPPTLAVQSWPRQARI